MPMLAHVRLRVVAVASESASRSGGSDASKGGRLGAAQQRVWLRLLEGRATLAATAHEDSRWPATVPVVSSFADRQMRRLATVMDPVPEDARDGDRPAALDPPGPSLGSSAIKSPAPDDYSTAGTAYGDARTQRMRRTIAVQEARGSRLAIAAAVLVSLVANVAVALAQVLSSPETAIVLGVIMVVLLGAGGLCCRGVGELRNSAAWKASGCFLCGAAYIGTATVALVNGVPLIFEP